MAVKKDWADYIIDGTVAIGVVITALILLNMVFGLWGHGYG